MNQFICYPKCSTCMKAKKYLETHHIPFSLRDIKENRLNEKELQAIIKRSNLDIKKFFNTSGLLYKELNLKEKLSSMSEKEKITLLASDGMLIKRPLFINDETILVGFKEEEYSKLLKQLL